MFPPFLCNHSLQAFDTKCAPTSPAETWPWAPNLACPSKIKVPADRHFWKQVFGDQAPCTRVETCCGFPETDLMLSKWEMSSVFSCCALSPPSVVPPLCISIGSSLPCAVALSTPTAQLWLSSWQEPLRTLSCTCPAGKTVRAKPSL